MSTALNDRTVVKTAFAGNQYQGINTRHLKKAHLDSHRAQLGQLAEM